MKSSRYRVNKLWLHYLPINLNKKILCWGYCLVFSYGFCGPNPMERLLENEVEGWNPYGSYQIGHEVQFERSTPSTELNPTESTESQRNNLRLHHDRLERFQTDDKIMRDRFKASEILGSLNKRLNYKSDARTLSSELVHTFVDWFKDKKRMQELSNLAKSAEKDIEGIGRIAHDLDKLLDHYHLEGSLFRTGSPFEKIILTSLQYLDDENLNVHNRLWTLSVLRILQSFLPRGYLDPIRQDPNTGPVCRGGLELFLTEGVDYGLSSKDISNERIDNFTVDESVAEALDRVELIGNIRHYLWDSGRDDQTPSLIAIHDNLLQTRSLVSGGLVESLASKSLQHMNRKDTPVEEIRCLDLIVKHLQKFYPVVRKIVESLPSPSKPFQVVQQRFKCQATLQPLIEKYLKKGDMDPYINSLLLQFLGWHSVNLDYVKKALHSCNVQDVALKVSKVGSYGADAAKGEKYYEDQDVFIDMMYEISPDLEGLQDHLNSVVKKDKESEHYHFKTNLIFKKEDKSSYRCPICLDKFWKGQRVVKLKCYCSLILHEQCTSILELASNGVGFECPTCRMGIKIPLAHNQHIFWG
ncbi:hypothetical protein DFH28DRAFT_220717 [Melampsora americana]|nr:hypothetical protein DFH28DRAFT_220717 [Melampsora americana]